MPPRPASQVAPGLVIHPLPQGFQSRRRTPTESNAASAARSMLNSIGRQQTSQSSIYEASLELRSTRVSSRSPHHGHSTATNSTGCRPGRPGTRAGFEHRLQAVKLINGGAVAFEDTAAQPFKFSSHSSFHRCVVASLTAMLHAVCRLRQDKERGSWNMPGNHAVKFLCGLLAVPLVGCVGGQLAAVPAPGTSIIGAWKLNPAASDDPRESHRQNARRGPQAHQPSHDTSSCPCSAREHAAGAWAVHPRATPRTAPSRTAPHPAAPLRSAAQFADDECAGGGACTR